MHDGAHRPPAAGPRGLLGLCAVLLLVVASGCASLPRDVVRPVSLAIAASPDTTLGRIAAASTPDPRLSGFRLVSWSVQALAMRLELAKRAERSLDVQYYVIHDDDTGRALLRALRTRAARDAPRPSVTRPSCGQPKRRRRSTSLAQSNASRHSAKVIFVTTATKPDPRRGEVWLVDFDVSVGQEQRKVRPAAVLNPRQVGRLDLREITAGIALCVGYSPI